MSKNIPEDKACYILATIKGPFGRIEQVSARMRLSEAAATCAAFQTDGEWHGDIENMIIVRLAVAS